MSSELGIVLFLLGVLGGGFSAVCFMSVRGGERHAKTIRGYSVKPEKPTAPPNVPPPPPPPKNTRDGRVPPRRMERA